MIIYFYKLQKLDKYKNGPTQNIKVLVHQFSNDERFYMDISYTKSRKHVNKLFEFITMRQLLKCNATKSRFYN